MTNLKTDLKRFLKRQHKIRKIQVVMLVLSKNYHQAMNLPNWTENDTFVTKEKKKVEISEIAAV